MALRGWMGINFYLPSLVYELLVITLQLASSKHRQKGNSSLCSWEAVEPFAMGHEGGRSLCILKSGVDKLMEGNDFATCETYYYLSQEVHKWIYWSLENNPRGKTNLPLASPLVPMPGHCQNWTAGWRNLWSNSAWLPCSYILYYVLHELTWQTAVSLKA